ncbi:hypothetical protein LUZ60_004947 [Juncus effusus]|nr:hypothetical protein LUZ60_004947 [Juncus effusus]
MTIASKLFFHNRSSRSDRSSSHSDAAEASHRRAGGRAGYGDHRRVGSAPALKSSGSLHRLQSSSQVLVVNDEGFGGKYNSDERLPDTVNQARERLLLRFRSINLIGNRQNDDSQNLTRPQSDASQLFTKKPLNFSGVITGPKRNFATEIGNECSICLEKFLEEEELLTQLKCKHVFHSVCLEKWVCIHSDCPYCRACIVA